MLIMFKTDLQSTANKCPAFGCKSGYKGAETDQNVQFHCFPHHNKELCEK